MRGFRLLSIRTGPWSFSFLLHAACFAAILSLGREHTIDLTLIDLGAPRTTPDLAVSATAKPKEDVWRLPETVHKTVAVARPIPTPEPEVVETTSGLGTGEGRAYQTVAQVSQLPRFVQQVQPAYPEEAKRANVEGLVVLQVEIDDSGHVQTVEVVKGLGYGCDEAAVAAVRQSTFSPALVGNEAVPVRIRIPFRFKFEY